MYFFSCACSILLLWKRYIITCTFMTVISSYLAIVYTALSVMLKLWSLILNSSLIFIPGNVSCKEQKKSQFCETVWLIGKCSTFLAVLTIMHTHNYVHVHTHVYRHIDRWHSGRHTVYITKQIFFWCGMRGLTSNTYLPEQKIGSYCRS